jgi:transposase
VELLIHYWNTHLNSKLLVSVRLVAGVEHRKQEPKRVRVNQRRLDEREASELVAVYLRGASVKDLVLRFGVHRHTVTSLLPRYGVELRLRGMRPEDVMSAGRLYRDGWSLARLGMKYGVDGTTIWQALKAAGVEMRPPYNRYSKQG